MTRQVLDRWMGWVLTQMNLCSQAPAVGYEPRSTSGKAGSRDLSGGDRGEADYYAGRYAAARDDEHRAEILGEARDHLRHLRGWGRSDEPRAAGETVDQYRARVLTETRGDSPRTVAQSRHAIHERTLRKWRRDAALDPENGHPVAGHAPAGDAHAEARRLLGEGKSVRYVAMRTGIPKSTLHDWTKEKAA